MKRPSLPSVLNPYEAHLVQQGEIRALRSLADDIEASGLVDDTLVGFIRARADRIERGEPRG